MASRSSWQGLQPPSAPETAAADADLNAAIDKAKSQAQQPQSGGKKKKRLSLERLKSKSKRPAEDGTAVLDVSSGPLGIGVSESADPRYRLQFNYCTNQSSAAADLKPLMVLTRVNGHDISGLPYEHVRNSLTSPVKLTFAVSDANANNTSQH